MDSLKHLVTEQRNSRSLQLSEMSALDIVKTMNDEDAKVAAAVGQLLPQIACVVEYVVSTLERGGRLIYVGAGTSGRLGVLDASECPPTFGVDYHTVEALIAGGEGAFIRAVEGAEDDVEQGAVDLQLRNLTAKDMIVGLAASGRTPYVQGALQYARSIGCVTALVTCNRNAALSQYADYPIEVEVGPEVLTGSTRLKAGTAQKMVLNMLTTAAMVRLGKAYQNLMIDFHVSNEKLYLRALSFLMQSTGVTREVAEQKLQEADNHVKTAIVMIQAGISKAEATAYLDRANGFVSRAIEQARLAQRN